MGRCKKKEKPGIYQGDDRNPMRGKEGGGNETHKERKAFNSRNKGREIRPKKNERKNKKEEPGNKEEEKGRNAS